MSTVLYGGPLSGHSHRVQAMLELLERPYTLVEVPMAERQTPAFLRLNPLGQIPVLEDEGLVLADSHAIVVYLCKRYDPSGWWLPEDPVGAAQVQRWLALAAGELKYGCAQARVIRLWGRPGALDAAQALGRRLLAFMEGHLAGRDWLAAEHPTVADVACYAYTARAPEGGLALEPYPAVRAWIGRVEAIPGMPLMPEHPGPNT